MKTVRDPGLRLWPLFVVRDLEASLRFYRDGLGFAVVGAAESDGAVYWCRLERGGVCVMLQQADPAADLAPSRDAFYFVCDDVDAVYEELRAKGMDVAPPSIAYYGMRQLHVPEPDGRELVFETPTEDWAG